MSATGVLTIDGLDINDLTNYITQELSMPPPPKKLHWVESADSDGSRLIDEANYDSRVIEATVRVTQRTTSNAAINALVALEDKIQLAERTEGGIQIVWSPPNSTYTYTMYALAGEIVDVVMDSSGSEAGLGLRSPVVKLRLDCKPFGYGSEVTSSTVTNTNALLELELANVAGDVNAEANIIVSDAGATSRMHVEVGRETNGYDGTTPQDLIVTQSDMTAVAGTSQTNSVGGSTAVWRATLVQAPVTICQSNPATPGQANHVGTYRAKLRCYAGAGTGPYAVRLTYRVGSDSPWQSTAWATPLVAQWSEVDLGLIDIPKVPAGQVQTWQFKVEATSGTVGDVFDFRSVLLIPAQQYGIGRGIRQSAGGAAIAYDTFAGSAGVALSAHTAPLPATVWGAAGDVTPELARAGNNSANRTAVNDTNADTGTIANIGTATWTDVEAIADVSVGVWAIGSALGDSWKGGVVSRFTSATTYLGGGLYLLRSQVSSGPGHGGGGTPTPTWDLYAILWTVDGALPGGLVSYSTKIGSFSISSAIFAYRVKLSVIGGTASLFLASFGNSQFGDAVISFAFPSLLVNNNDGKVGLYDGCKITGTGNREAVYSNFVALNAVPASFPAINSGQSAEFRSDDAQTENVAGTAFGDVPSYRGAEFFIPPAGASGRKSRVVAKARSQDVNDYRDAIYPDDVTPASTSLQVKYTPRYLVIPRS